MKKAIIIILFFLAFTKVDGQVNLVPNGDFEIYTTLPFDISQSNCALGWNNVNGNYSGVTGSPDYYNQLSFAINGSIQPYSGKGQMGFITYVNSLIWREYISTSFSVQMKIGKKYEVSFYLTNGTGAELNMFSYSNNIGINFSTTLLNQIVAYPILVNPQIEIDTLTFIYNYWKHYTYTYTATDTFKYITIGNFKDDAHTLVQNFGQQSRGAYYFIDKIEIIPLLSIKGDSVICTGNPVTLKTYGDSIVKWKSTLNPNIILATDSFITVYPTVTTTYFAYTYNDTAFFTVNVVNPPVINLGNDTVLCHGQSMLLNATTPFATYLWQNNTTNPTFNVTQQGTYWLKVTIDSNCIAKDSINVKYIGAPSLNAISDTSLCEGNPFIISIPNGDYSILWNDGDINSIRYFNQSGLFTITLTNQCGIASDSFKLEFINCNVDLIIPNIITPNGDGYNDYFVIKDAKECILNIQIYNKWGVKVFEDGNYKNNWNDKYKGKDLADGVYYYILEAKNLNTNKHREYNGSLTILR